MKTIKLASNDAMMILGIDRETMTEIRQGSCIDRELLLRYQLLIKLVTGRDVDMVKGLDWNEDIRVKIAREREQRKEAARELRRKYARIYGGAMA